MSLVDLALEAVRIALKLYAAASGPPLDLEQLGRDCGVEIARIDKQQAADEAAENKEAASHE